MNSPLISPMILITVLHQLDQKIIYPHYDFKHLTEKYFEIGMKLRNDETIISSISVTDIVFDVYLRKWNFRAIPEVKTWSYFLTIPKLPKIIFRLNNRHYNDNICI